MDTHDAPTEAAVVAGLAKENAMLGQEIRIQRTHPEGAPFAVVLQGDEQKILPLAIFDPPRKAAGVQFYETSDFIDYVKLYADASSRIFCDVEARKFTAILDYHKPDADDASGRRGQHTATLTLRLTPTMDAWMKLAAGPIPQAVLAEFLEDRHGDIEEPAGAEILELAKTLEVKNDVAFKGAQRAEDGGYNLMYQETIAAKAGQAGTLTIPTRLLLSVQVFQGGKLVHLPVRLRFGLNNGAVSFRLTFLGLENQLRDEVRTVREQIETETGRAAWAGSARLG